MEAKNQIAHPGPWRASDPDLHMGRWHCDLLDANGERVLTLSGARTKGEMRVLAARIVEAVNERTRWFDRNSVNWQERAMAAEDLLAEERTKDALLSEYREALAGMMVAYAPSAEKTVREEGEEFLHSAVRNARALLARLGR